ncbi:Ig-like domain-containing protein [Isoalcanivorax indicus]|uniref:Ig-like domain-containing protein n=1 Tax=Isoalcanivorax indicus TaxID=2202653 RepID=UPI000DBA6580|nr:Ig-like domain-containing protein [Isoalcanivorax indicus]
MNTNAFLRATILSLFSLLLLSACDNSPTPFQPPEIGHGLIYAYPLDQAVDLPQGSKVLLAFSNNVDPQALEQGCGTLNGSQTPDGPFCIVGPNGPLEVSEHAVIVNDGRTVQVNLPTLVPGGEYAVWAREPLAPGAVNLPDEEPLLRFTVRQPDPLPGVPPAVLAINHESPARYSEAPETPPVFTFMDFSPVRLTFTEPLAQQSVRYGETFSFVHVDSQGNASLVPASVYAERHYVSVQPKQDLTPGERYELRLTSDIQDLTGQSMASVAYVFSPQSSRQHPDDANPPIRQVLRTFPAPGDPGFPQVSRLTDMKLNDFELVNDLLGAVEASTYPDSLEAWLADPVIYPNYTPILSRHGQGLRLTGINPARIGGEINTALMTGDIHGHFFTNVTAYLLRNPFRPPNTNPDDDLAPLMAVMHFDAAMTGGDPLGNATFNQNVMHVQAPGVVAVYDGSLNFEVFTTLQLEALGGAARINADFSLGIRSSMDFVVDETNPAPPVITGSYPQLGDINFPTRENLLLTFSETLATTALDEIMLLDMDAGGSEVPIRVNHDGATVTITPRGELRAGAAHQVVLPQGLSDAHLFNPLPVTPQANDALEGQGVLAFRTADYSGTAVPPLLSVLHPGVGCALTDTQAQQGKSGRCTGGRASDTLYELFRYEIGTAMNLVFSQPMNVDTLRLGQLSSNGTQCENGSVCLGEQVDGQWQSLTPGVHVEDRAMQLYPSPDALQHGQQYRLVVNGNTAPYFRNHSRFGNLRLNTTPLVGIGGNGAQGGGNIVIDFEAIDPVSTIFASVRTMPYADTNGNGTLDNGEQPQLLNSGRLQVTGTGGLITAASPSGQWGDTAFTAGGLPVSFFPIEPLDLGVPDLNMTQDGSGRWCTPEGYEDDDGNPVCIDTDGGFMAPVEVGTPVVLGTELSLSATLLGLVPLNIDTGALTLRVRPREEGPKLGYVINQPGESQAKFLIRLDAYLDAPDLNLLGLGNPSNLHSLPISAYVMGPVVFLEDGRLALEAENLTAIRARLNLDLREANICGIPLLNLLCGIGSALLVGHADLMIASGDFQITVANHPSRGLRLAAPGNE